MRKTKIVCTLGPASTSVEQLKKMTLAGMNVARINMSHGSFDEHRERVENVKKVREELGIALPIMCDLKGPEVRIGVFENGKIEVVAGQEMCFCARDVKGNESIVSVTYKELYKDVAVGNTILLNDGLLTFEVTRIENQDIFAVAKNSGSLSDRKGLFVPNAKLNMPFLSDVDKRDIDFAISVDAELIAASFVQDGYCMQEIRDYLKEKGANNIALIAKIESQQGLNNIDSIIEKSEGIMVARGDLGVELPYEKLPAVQKFLISRARTRGKFVITATEMLESMITKLRPTRAEIADVANAVYDGTSCVMLSAESAIGIDPVNTITTMARIAEEAERNINYNDVYRKSAVQLIDNNDAISHATVNTSFDIDAKAIVVYTASGNSARMVSRFRPTSPIVALTSDRRVYQQLQCSWGVTPMMCCNFFNTDVMFLHAEDTVKQLKLADEGDNIVITAGVPLGSNVGTNLIKVEKIELETRIN